MVKTERATLQDGSTIEYFSETVGDGAEKECHFSTDGQSAVLFYKAGVDTKDAGRRQRLDFILNQYNPTLGDHGDYWRRHFCWPTAIVTKPTLGIVTPKYPANFFFPKTAGDIVGGREKQGKWFTGKKARTFVPQEERGDWLGYLRLGIMMSRAVRRMHSAGLAHSDLSNKNVLVDPSTGTSVIIDIDTLVVPGVFAPKVIGTKGYVAPEVVAGKDLPSRTTDLHALSVLLYEYLLLRHPLDGPKIHSSESAEEDERLAFGERALYIEHPSDRSNRPRKPLTPRVDALGEYLAPMFERAFVDGLHDPSSRPSASEWESALYRTTDLLLPCSSSSCSSRWYVLSGDGTSTTCPSCGTRYGRSIPVLNLYKEGKSGTFALMNQRLAVFHGWGLSKWHVYSNVRAGAIGVDTTRQAYAVFHGGQWHFVNERLNFLEVNGEPVRVGDSVILEPGMQMRFSTEEHGVLAVVQMFS